MPHEIGKMSNNKLTIELNGEVSLDDFSIAMQEFKKLIHSLNKKYVSATPINWIIRELKAGSALATIEGEPSTEDDIFIINQIVNEFEKIGENAQTGKINDIEEDLRKPVVGITGLINGSIKSINFSTEKTTHSLDKNYFDILKSQQNKVIPLESFGAIQGRVQNIFRYPNYKITMLELLRNNVVNCFLNSSFKDVMRDSWGEIAIVQGLVTRDSESGLPTSIKDVKKIEIIKDAGNWRDAIGCASGLLEGKSPEGAIRKIRDA